MSTWRDALRMVNGFDEKYVGWGQEDDDLGRRLYRAGIKPRILVDRALVSHMPHPARHDLEWDKGANVERFKQRLRSHVCRHGLSDHPHPDVRVTTFAADP